MRPSRSRETNNDKVEHLVRIALIMGVDVCVGLFPKLPYPVTLYVTIRRRWRCRIRVGEDPD
ncbi:MAG: hypothetical protein ACRDTR_11400, partial [Rubrobacter sp.]